MRLFWRIIHSPTRSKAPSSFSQRCSRLDSQHVSENPRVIRRSLTMMLCKPLSNLLCARKEHWTWSTNMAAMASKFNFECVIQYYTDQWYLLFDRVSTFTTQNFLFCSYFFLILKEISFISFQNFFKISFL